VTQVARGWVAMVILLLRTFPPQLVQMSVQNLMEICLGSSCVIEGHTKSLYRFAKSKLILSLNALTLLQVPDTLVRKSTRQHSLHVDIPL